MFQRTFGLLVPLLIGVAPPATKIADPLAAAGPLVGHWVADADPAAPGVNGWSQFDREAQGQAIIRKNHAEYPANKDHPASVHDDVMVLFSEHGQLKAEYIDSEGHAIRYAVAAPSASSLVFSSDPQPSEPRFRLTYSWPTKDQLDLLFEIAPPAAPNLFKPYIRAHLHRG